MVMIKRYFLVLLAAVALILSISTQANVPQSTVTFYLPINLATQKAEETAYLALLEQESCWLFCESAQTQCRVSIYFAETIKYSSSLGDTVISSEPLLEKLPALCFTENGVHLIDDSKLMKDNNYLITLSWQGFYPKDKETTVFSFFIRPDQLKAN